jgi:hypothetical protein
MISIKISYKIQFFLIVFFGLFVATVTPLHAYWICGGNSYDNSLCDRACSDEERCMSSGTGYTCCIEVGGGGGNDDGGSCTPNCSGKVCGDDGCGGS